ncbi:hypothetical protein C3F09_02685 [candidate division GN15 bacterium]|uniref:Polysaccharide chain length determinant N-terminal domain-containing protein n=1 Tax=candidate division GN15 bacterium TaxID=2072418 RepID=A0A855X3B7_9BACT|nr:MAG: hypothetical protein C3F09_02685 [candidate division GN15 bacterium]
MTEPTGNNLWTILEAIARHRGAAFAVVLVITLGAAVVSLLLPSWYQAEAFLLPPKDVSASMDQLSKLSEVVSVTGGLNLPVMVTPSDVYARILRSKRVTDRIIEKFNLKARYGTSTWADTYAEYFSHAKFGVTEEGLVFIRVEDRDPQMAADMANAIIDELNTVNQEIVSGRARRNRQFIEARLAEVKAKLDSTRSDLETFQQTHRTVDFDAQTKLAIDQAADLKVSLARVELEISMDEQTLGKDNPELIEKMKRRDAIRGQLRQLESGGNDTSYFSLPVSSIPGLKGQYELLFSRVKVTESIYNMLLEQLEQARIQEEEQSPTISVLDRARAPEIRSRPRRTMIVLIAFAISLIAALLLAATLEYLDKLRVNRPDDYKRAQYVIGAFLGWIPGIGRRTDRT